MVREEATKSAEWPRDRFDVVFWLGGEGLLGYCLGRSLSLSLNIGPGTW